jgi:hypothetical protein
VQAKQFYFAKMMCKQLIFCVSFICDLVEAVKESEVVINQLTSEGNNQTV